MCADLEDMVYDPSEVLIKDVEEVSLLCHVEQELIVFNIIVLTNGFIWIEVSLNFVDAILQCTDGLIAHLAQIERV